MEANMKKWRTIGPISEKDRIVYQNILGSLVIRGGSLLLSFFTMPGYLHYFQDQGILGVWYTVLSVLTWVLNFDLGIGNGLRNTLSGAIARGDDREAQACISSAYRMTGGCVMALGILGIVLFPRWDWNRIFGIDRQLVSPAALLWVIQCTYLGILLQFFLRLICSVLYAMQKSAVNNLLSLSTTLLMLLCLWTMPDKGPEENLKQFSAAYLFFSNLPPTVATVALFCGPLKNCRPRFSTVSRGHSGGVIRLGGAFFACQILYMLIANTNEFLITRYAGPESVVQYQIYYRLFSLGSMVFTLALTPVWSAVSRAVAQGDHPWLRSLYRRLRVLSVFGVCCEFLLIVFLQWLIDLWLGDAAIRVNYGHALLFAAFGGTMLVQGALSTIANGMGKLNIQIVFYAAGFLAKAVLVPVFIRWNGSWAAIVAVNVLILLPYCIAQKRQLDKLLR